MPTNHLASKADRLPEILADDVITTHGGQQQAYRAGMLVAVTDGAGQWTAWINEERCNVVLLAAWH